jgi:hypothetical protein
MVLTVPSSPGLSTLHFSGKVPSGFGNFTLTATDAANTANNCRRTYNFNAQLTSGGWGDPHITPVDGVHYDFQSAGEFTALRGGGLEIQTRQTPVATTSLPGANPYTGLATCVAVYSAVAARVCDHRVSYQPNISGVPDPSGLQLRVDGKLTTLGPEGIDLRCGPVIDSPTRGAIANLLTGGRIVKSPAGDGIEIHYSDGTQLVVTPAWWPDQQKWYLNVNVYGTIATEGIFGKLAKDSWLPALPDSTSLGPKPGSLHQRYVDLYEKFADAWRVTDATSLFDYAPGTSTATFTLRSWPRESPQSCAIEGEPSAQPVDVSVAEKYCSAIVDKNMKADCVFDVSVTGHTGFAQTYQLTQQLQPGITETTVKDDKAPTRSGESVTFTATVVQKLSRGGGAPTGTVQFILDGGRIGNPVTLDSNGRASWSTSSLQVGKHQIVAQYIPTGWGGLFMASSSPEESHTVLPGGVVQYAVKFICGKSTGDVVVPGTYFTAINVHNPTDKPIVFKKKFAVARPGEEAGPVSPFFDAKLGPDQALEIDCKDILRQTQARGDFLKGFAVIESDVELDVVAVYTVGGLIIDRVEAFHLEHVSPRRLK